ncbi:MAG TPA: 30S ribosome-binding factor RbfA [Solirubrobacterales bacterium]|nr:30S ribosome-binding factor RbfA [Solirubrobacterales bacterium]HNG57497.1 30S ribosome-binding factor RbfA [Solirubrobacterales bacterium]
MSKARMRRVNEVLRQVISDAITNDLSDPRLEMATVTSVDTTPDLRHAKVYFTVLGDDAAKADALKGLGSAHSLLQGKVAAETRMKHTPALAFEYDESIESGMRIDALLAEGEAKGREDGE